MPPENDPSSRRQRFADPSLQSLVSQKIEILRKRLLDFSRRNPLVHITFRSTTSSLIRVVDELPDMLRLNLTSDGEMRLAALPPIEDDPKDELTNAFLDALFLARREDEAYIRALEELDPDDPRTPDRERQLERDLKDRLREKLGLPKRQAKDAVSLVEHAREYGIEPSFDLPLPSNKNDDGRHDDDDIQTLLTPDRLRRAGKTIFERGRSIEREIGVNVQHAVFGLVEWRHPEEKDVHFSPLLLAEVRLERRPSLTGEEYWVGATGPVTTNTTLREKFLTEHRLELPSYEGGSVESYFDLVRDMAPPGWDWRVRRQVVFGIFPSSRMAMYHDLDPSKRPLAKKELIVELLASAGGESAGSYADDYEPDSPEYEDLVAYVVRDADASQWSSLVDVIRGKNVALEGPPGSGKSQTIVNMVASCLASGKRVLFVAEKLTALDVVKSRIEASELGEFVLALQAGKASAEQVYASIKDRLDLPVNSDQGGINAYKLRKEQLEKHKVELQKFLDALSSQFGASEMTVQEILGRSVQTAELRDTLPREIRRMAVPRIDEITPADRADILDAATALERSLELVDRIPELWMHATTDVATRDEAEDLAEDAGELATLLGELRSSFLASEYAPLGETAWASARFAHIADAFRAMIGISDTISTEAMLPLLDPGLRETALKLVQVLNDRISAADALSSRVKQISTAGDAIEHAIEFAQANGGRVDPRGIATRLAGLETKAAAAADLIAVFQTLGGRWSRTDISLSTVRKLREVIARTAPEITRLRGLGNLGDLQRDIAAFEARRSQLHQRLEELQETLPKCGDHPVETVLAAADTIEAGGIFSAFRRTHKEAVAFFKSLRSHAGSTPKSGMVRLLREYAVVLRDRDLLNDPTMAARFGPGFVGYNTDPQYLAACQIYAEQVGQLLRQWPELYADVLSGSSAMVHELSLDDDLPNLTYEATVSALETSRKEIGMLKSRLALARTVRTPFRGEEPLTVETLEQLKETLESIEAQDSQIDALSQQLPPALAGNADLIEEACDAIMTAVDALGTKLAGQLLDARDLAGTAAKADELSRLQAQVVSSGEAFVARVGLHIVDVDLAELAELEERLVRASASPLALLDRGTLKRAERRLRHFGLNEVVDWALGPGRSQARTGLPNLVDAILARSLADAAYSEHAAVLREQSGIELNQIRREIAAKDREVIEHTRKVVRSKLIARAAPPAGVSYGRRSEFTEMALIRNELGKKRRRVAIRELTRRSWRALMEIKPCWMMSPLAVSQFLAPQARFDVVIIDEASQMTPENALGAISRADQAVIVGDTKQLPPTSFFNRVVDDSDVDDDLREDSESILDLANLTFTPIRQLRWHYRSQHADLIRFSNHWMYDGKLTIFPSADRSHAGLGVELVKVDGTYSGQTNIEEARKVVQAAVRFMTESPDISLGICTMNTKQRDLIDEEIDRERERNPHVLAYIQRWEERNDGLEGFFVKNLEAIQGDERDVMFISTLYGPEVRGGKTHQRFGPINTAQGHRRLNVLFSRAKKKIVTFTSMNPTDILVDAGKSKGVQMLRNWLEYSSTGQLSEREREGAGFESPFEEHVATVIRGLGFEAVPQVGTAGYRVDLGVRHPDWVHGFVAGVECDGASYHSSRSARDRDRLREEILTSLGWKLYRIWSTDWFGNPHLERERLGKFLTDRLAELKAQPPRKLVSSFGEVLRTTSHLPPPTLSPEPALPATSARRPAGRVAQPDLLATPKANVTDKRISIDRTKVVGIGSKVTIRHEGPKGVEQTYTISNDQNDPSRGILRKDVPLARAMLDLEVDDDFEYAAGSNVRSAIIVRIEG